MGARLCWEGIGLEWVSIVTAAGLSLLSTAILAFFLRRREPTILFMDGDE